MHLPFSIIEREEYTQCDCFNPSEYDLLCYVINSIFPSFQFSLNFSTIKFPIFIFLSEILSSRSEIFSISCSLIFLTNLLWRFSKFWKLLHFSILFTIFLIFKFFSKLKVSLRISYTYLSVPFLPLVYAGNWFNFLASSSKISYSCIFEL